MENIIVKLQACQFFITLKKSDALQQESKLVTIIYPTALYAAQYQLPN